MREGTDVLPEGGERRLSENCTEYFWGGQKTLETTGILSDTDRATHSVRAREAG